MYGPFLPAQSIISFDDQGWNSNQSLDTTFTINNFHFSGTQNIYTNYGYNFNVDSVSIFFLFQNRSTDKVIISVPPDERFRLNSLAVYQVSEQSTDHLVIEGWINSTMVYSESFTNENEWSTLTLNYENINKVIIRLDSSGVGGISDYNFDNFSYAMMVPVELISFTGISQENDIKLEWATSTELNNYGFDIERKDSVNDWQKIGFVEGKGTTTNTNRYVYSDNTVKNGYKYSYRLKQKDLDGSYVNSYEIEVRANLKPLAYSLSQNYPNPFNPSTTIDYNLPEDSRVIIKIYNILGEEVTTLVNETEKEGKYSVTFNGDGYSSGIYIYEMRAGNFISRSKMMLIK